MENQHRAFLTTRQAANRCGVSHPTMKRWARAVLRTDPRAAIRKGEYRPGCTRYLIDADYLAARFVRQRYPRSVRATPAGRALIDRIAAQADHPAGQDRVIRRQQRLIRSLRLALGRRGRRARRNGVEGAG